MKNYFANRKIESMVPSMIDIGDLVYIIEKENQGTKNPNDLVKGYVIRVLSKGKKYKNGTKVKIKLHPLDHRYSDNTKNKEYIGRVQYIKKKD